MVICARLSHASLLLRGSVRPLATEPSGELITVFVMVTPLSWASLANWPGVPLKTLSTHQISTFLNPRRAAVFTRSSNGRLVKAISKHRPSLIANLPYHEMNNEDVSRADLPALNLAEQAPQHLINTQSNCVAIFIRIIMVNFNMDGPAQQVERAGAHVPGIFRQFGHQHRTPRQPVFGHTLFVQDMLPIGVDMPVAHLGIVHPARRYAFGMQGLNCLASHVGVG